MSPTSRHLRLRVKHLGRLAGDVGRYAVVNRSWWLVPLVVVLAVVGLVVTTTQVVVPAAVYTLI